MRYESACFTAEMFYTVTVISGEYSGILGICDGAVGFGMSGS